MIISLFWGGAKTFFVLVRFRQISFVRFWNARLKGNFTSFGYRQNFLCCCQTSFIFKFQGYGSYASRPSRNQKTNSKVTHYHRSSSIPSSFLRLLIVQGQPLYCSWEINSKLVVQWKLTGPCITNIKVRKLDSCTFITFQPVIHMSRS